jgi:hypothetical protein
MSRRVHSTPVLFSALLCSCALFSGCSETTDNVFGPGNPGAGTGGSIGTITTVPQQGTLPNPYAQGGAKATGGAAAGIGGSAAVVGAGGAVAAKGGAAATGTGGAPIIIGSTAKGGTASTTTSGTIKTGTGTEVTFAKGKGVGAMVGYGFVAMGSADTVSSPTCGTTETEITAAAPCKTNTNWSAEDSLCITGEIPIVVDDDYDSNWGMSVGLNATDPATAGLGQAFKSITISVTGTPLTGLRAKVHRLSDTDAVDYCATLKPGVAMPLTSFTRTCYDAAKPGTALTAADVLKIDKVQVQVPSSATAAITVSELCITGITFQ